MRKLQSKSLLTLVIALVIIGISTTSATLYIGNKKEVVSDSTIKKSDTVALERFVYTVQNPNRVTYPVILREHRKESKAYIKNYIRKERSYIKMMFRRGKNYMPVARDIFDRYNVPREFQVLPALESNFFAHAVSPAGAVGYWQFMPQLARQYGLKVNGKNDERKNFTKSTIAAAKFIKDQLHIYDNDILLVVASYNCGPGRVNYAIRKAGLKDPNYWSLQRYLPAETRRFVMNFLALNVVEMNYNKFLANNINLDEPSTIQIAIEQPVQDEVAQAIRPPKL